MPKCLALCSLAWKQWRRTTKPPIHSLMIAADDARLIIQPNRSFGCDHKLLASLRLNPTPLPADSTIQCPALLISLKRVQGGKPSWSTVGKEVDNSSRHQRLKWMVHDWSNLSTSASVSINWLCLTLFDWLITTTPVKTQELFCFCKFRQTYHIQVVVIKALFYVCELLQAITKNDLNLLTIEQLNQKCSLIWTCIFISSIKRNH